MGSTIHADAIHTWAVSAPSLSKQGWRNHFLAGTKPLQVHDTAWFAMTDADWPDIKAALEAWLDLQNFDPAGRQIAKLAATRG